MSDSDAAEPTRELRPVCAEHGELDEFDGRGYSLGHRTQRGEPNELDLEGITFTFERGDDGAFRVRSDARGSYLSKFGSWKETILDTVTNRADSEDLACAKCGGPVLVLDENEEGPAWFEDLT